MCASVSLSCDDACVLGLAGSCHGISIFAHHCFLEQRKTLYFGSQVCAYTNLANGDNRNSIMRYQIKAQLVFCYGMGKCTISVEIIMCNFLPIQETQ